MRLKLDLSRLGSRGVRFHSQKWRAKVLINDERYFITQKDLVITHRRFPINDSIKFKGFNFWPTIK